MLYNIKTRRKSYITLNKKTTIVKNFSFSLARHTYIKSLCNQKKKDTLQFKHYHSHAISPSLYL